LRIHQSRILAKGGHSKFIFWISEVRAKTLHFLKMAPASILAQLFLNFASHSGPASWGIDSIRVPNVHPCRWKHFSRLFCPAYWTPSTLFRVI